MTAIELLLSRASAVRLEAPAPDDDALRTIVSCALRSPDHGRLRPWRFILIRTDMRERFGELLAASLERREPAASPDKLRREREKAMRAPMILVVAHRSRPSEKVPQVEQLLSAAAAAQTVLLAAHALGFGAVWKTGAAAYDAEVRRALGLAAEDAIVGFIYLGATSRPAPAERPDAADFLEDWGGSA